MDEPGKVIGPTWQFKPEDENPPAEQPANQHTADSVAWTASEFVLHQKGFGWYLLIGLGGLLLAAVVYLATKDIISSVMVAIVGISFAVFGARKPRTLSYQVDSDGIHVGNKSYGWETFKSFSVMEEGAINSIYFMPLKRFMPAITAYYAPDDEDKILNVIANYLPHEDRQLDFVDKLMHKIRF